MPPRPLRRPGNPPPPNEIPPGQGALVRVPGAGESVLAQRPELNAKVRDYARRSRADETWRAYENDWRHFEAWCARAGATALPATPDTVAGYLADLAEDHAVATVERHCSSISQRHKLMGFAGPRGDTSPTADKAVRAVIQGIRRVKGVTAKNAKAPVTLDVVRKMVKTLDLQTLVGQRDRAVILVGFALAGRRSEIVHYRVEDMTEVEEGLIFFLDRSKTDQESEGRPVAVARSPDQRLCPVVALKAWLERARIRTGPIFRGLTRGGNRVRPAQLSPGGVAKIVKAAAAAAGLEGARFAGHSLRAGHVTEARARGVSWDRIMEQGGWKKLETVKRYDRGTKDPFKVSSAADVFAKKEK